MYSNYAHMKANSDISLSQDQKSWKAADAFISSWLQTNSSSSAVLFHPNVNFINFGR